MRHSLFILSPAASVTEDIHHSPPVSGAADERRTIAEIAELAGGLAHELRNPLSTVMMNLQLLAEELANPAVDPDDMRRRALLKLDTVLREARRLQVLFDDFLHVVGPCRPLALPTDLRDVVRRLADFVAPELRAARINVVVETPDEPVPAAVDEDLLRQAMLNIVRNAQEASAPGGTIRLSVRAAEKWAEIAVADEGVGIAPEDHDRVFRPFFSTKREGTGLGLSITRRIVAEHGGTLSFTSTPGRGTTFVMRMPLRKE